MIRGYIFFSFFVLTVCIGFFTPAPLDDLTINLNLNESPKDGGLKDYETLYEEMEMKAGQVSKSRPVVIGGYENYKNMMKYDEMYVFPLSQWIYRNRQTKPRAGMASATLNNEIYIAGGWDKDKKLLSSVSKRTLFDKWHDLPNLQIKRVFPTLTAVEMLFEGTLRKTLVIAGGEDKFGNPFKSTEIKSPENHTWSWGPPMIEPRKGHAAVWLNNKIYALGGIPTLTKPTKTTEFFDTTDSTWNVGPPMIEERSNHAATVLGETIYICGGSLLWQIYYIHLQSCEYGNGQEPYKKLADMKEPRSFFGMVTVDGEIWAIGGQAGYRDRGYKIKDSVEIYDPAAQMWKGGKKMNKPRWVFATAVARIP